MHHITEILNERGSNYGLFETQARLSQELKGLVRGHLGEHGTALKGDQEEALEMILHKIARIVNGNPNHIDSWVDISGYATLIADRLMKE